MQTGWRVGSLFGIPFYIDPYWFLVVGLVTISNGMNWQQEYPQWGPLLPWVCGLLMALLLFTSVVLHELGHSLVAKSQGIQVSSITLFLFGGIASLEEESRTPGKAFQVAIAGPAVSLGLFFLLRLLAGVLPVDDHPLRVMALSLATVNLVLVLFNLIPGLPLDGGQILKAAVWKLTGNRFQGAHWAARAGRFLGWGAIVLGLSSALLTSDYGGLWITLLGWFVVQNASAYDRLTELQETLLQIKAQEAMTREFRVIEATLTLRQFADEYLLAINRPPVYFAASDGRYRGMVLPDELHDIERSEWETQNLFRIIHPLTEIPTVSETASLVEVIRRMEAEQLPRITVLSPAGAVAGVIDRGDVVRALAERLNLLIPDEAIRRIKDEGSYPPGLPLGTIAQSAMELSTSGQRETEVETHAR